jgi:hypothetical protein
MAIDHPAAEKGARPAVATLANRVTILTFATSFAFIAGIVALPGAAGDDVAGLVRAAAVAPLLVAFAFGAWTRRARAQLRRARADGADRPSAPPDAAPGKPNRRPRRASARGERVHGT